MESEYRIATLLYTILTPIFIAIYPIVILQMTLIHAGGRCMRSVPLRCARGHPTDLAHHLVISDHVPAIFAAILRDGSFLAPSWHCYPTVGCELWCMFMFEDNSLHVLRGVNWAWWYLSRYLVSICLVSGWNETLVGTVWVDATSTSVQVKPLFAEYIAAAPFENSVCWLQLVICIRWLLVWTNWPLLNSSVWGKCISR